MGAAVLVAGAVAVLTSSKALVSPLGALRAPTPAEARFIATVEERLPAGSYVYSKVRPRGGEARWIVSTHDAAIGQDIAVEVFGISRDFNSRRLGRTFQTLSFASTHPHQEQQ